MNIQTIISEPPSEALDLVDRLCREYKINVAIHNHPNRRGSLYWNPDTVLKACKARSSYMGACPDIGHWMRSGIQPVEALKKLKGRIISLHFKDIHEFGHPRAQDVVWGAGAVELPAVLAELNRQNYQGPFIIEYERFDDKLMDNLSDSISYYNKMVKD